jgi:hypothetical protein
MVAHRFARAAESGDPAQIAALLAEDVTFHTPILTQNLHGKDLTLRFPGEATRITGKLTCIGEVTGGNRVFLFWKGTIDDREISGVTVLADDAAGPSGDLTVLPRSRGVAASFRDTMPRAPAGQRPSGCAPGQWSLSCATEPSPASCPHCPPTSGSCPAPSQLA